MVASNSKPLYTFIKLEKQILKSEFVSFFKNKIWDEEKNLPASVKKLKKDNHVLVKYITADMDDAPFL